MSLLRQIVPSLSQAVKQHPRQWAQFDNHTLALSTTLDLTRSKSELVLENVLLRQCWVACTTPILASLVCTDVSTSWARSRDKPPTICRWLG
jgi:hypothetical protein